MKSCFGYFGSQYMDCPKCRIKDSCRKEKQNEMIKNKVEYIKKSVLSVPPKRNNHIEKIP
jgi:hypothetical protein